MRDLIDFYDLYNTDELYVNWRKDNVYWYLMSFLLVGHALIYPRAPLLFDPRLVTWSLLLLLIVMTITTHQTQIVNWLDSIGKKKEGQP